MLFETVEALYAEQGRSYGLDGFDIHDALKAALRDLTGAAGAVLAPSGLAACALPFLALCRAGDEVLITDSAYGPTRRFCDGMLARFGVRARYYDPRIGGEIVTLISPSTRLILLESPGSLTFEVQDVPAIARVARARDVVTAIDDTWSAGVHFRPFEHGVDISIQALTKYQAGHADVLLGAVLTRDRDLGDRLHGGAKELGLGVGAAEDAYLTLRGLRTMPLRLAHQDQTGRRIAAWLSARPEVARVLHPALPDHPDHAIWNRDFSGAAGVFGVVLRRFDKACIAAMLEGLELFAMGFSWGGYESLIIPCDQQLRRSLPHDLDGPLLRLSIGLEDESDLIADLEAGLARLATPA